MSYGGSSTKVLLLSKACKISFISSSIYREVNDDEKWEELWENRANQAMCDHAKRVTWNGPNRPHIKCNSYQNRSEQLVKHV